ncbi:MAG: putative transcriptional regulator AlgH [Oceanicaulis sp. HLUCCA04]|nr:MAG: putative transcriptional regulator AlgH [Oceanicaulis sp. HLUCCA04]
MERDRTLFDGPYLKGKILIASPLIGDPRFDRSVVFMCAHGDDQAMGIIINKPMRLRLPTLFEQLGVQSEIEVPDRAVLDGGPVDRDRGFVLHSDDFEHEPATLKISQGLALTATNDVLEAIASPSPPRRSTLALGYAGWEAGQLEDEIAANAWLVAEADEDLVFGETHDDKWAAALRKIKVNPEHLTGSSGHA